MLIKSEKIFIDRIGNLITFPFDTRRDTNNSSYYKYIKEKKKEGYIQFLLTSDMMINIAINFLSKDNASISNLQLYNDDEIAKKEIMSYFNQYYQQKISSDKLRYDLSYLYNENSIDIVEISFKIKKLSSIRITNNGIISYKDDQMKDIFMNIVNDIWEQ